MTNKKILILIFVVAFLTLLIGCLPGLTPPPPKGVISGRIMVPSSETTKDITGWIPVANATVTLTDSSGITHTVTTDEDGYYTFTNIAVNANTIITATAVIDGNTVIVKDVIPQAVTADEDYNAKTADAESTALALIVEELLEQGFYPGAIDLEEIQDSDNFTEVVGQVTSVLEENGNVTTDPGVTNIVDYVAGDIINPPAYTPPEELPEPEPEPEPGPEPGPETVILTYIVVLPVEMTLFVGEFEVITPVTAHYSDGSSANIVLGNCTYISSAVGIAKVSDAGVVTAVTAGTATITVSYAGKTDTLEVTVNPILLTSIIVLPEAMTLFVGESGTITSVTAHYSDGFTTGIALGNCTYSSSAPGVATVVASEEYGVNAISEGIAIITVSYGGKADTVEVTVNPVELDYIAVAPTEMTLFVLGHQSFEVTAYYNNGISADITSECGHTTSNFNVAHIVEDGASHYVQSTSLLTGTATITVSYTEGGITKEATIEVTVNPVILTHIVVEPETMVLFVGKSKAIASVTAYYNDESVVGITPLSECAYASSILGIAIIDSNGIVTAVAEGQDTITVSYGGKTDDVEIEVISKLVIAEVNTMGRPQLLGTIKTDGFSIIFNIRAIGQADDGDEINQSKYYSQSNFDNEYFTASAAGKLLKYNMYNGNTTPYWGTSWGDATNPLPEGVTFNQVEDGDDFVYAVSMSYDILGISDGDTFSVQIKARDFNDDFVQSYSGYVGFDGEYSQYRGLWITDTGEFSVTLP